MPWGSGSIEANLGTIIFVALTALMYLTLITTYFYRLLYPKPVARAIAPHEVAPRLSTLIAMGLPEQIADPVARGQKINAIKAYRETYGVDLKRAKDAVEAWESALRAVEQASQPDT